MNATRNTSLMCAIRGPILMITVGTLFAIDHMGGPRFSSTWPAILIVVGVLKLLERVTPRAAQS
ncbi:MAG: hypothetical protein HY820_04760 [Acidobacteria bacterium]|nr:hypothetical protein [Acidobacteriota bacterium]